VQVMETSKTKLGADHHSTLSSINNLTFIWEERSRDTEAISLMKECVRLRERKLRANHPRFISSLNTLAGWKAQKAEARASPHGGVAESVSVCVERDRTECMRDSTVNEAAVKPYVM
jgi:Tetratricopeptide repeat